MPKEGRKYDTEKVPLWLLPKPALIEVCKVLQAGQRKYGAWNWAKGMQYSRLLSAENRHTFAFECGEDRDPETNLLTLAHAAANLLFLIQYQLSGLGIDDRYAYYSKKHLRNDQRRTQAIHSRTPRKEIGSNVQANYKTLYLFEANSSKNRKAIRHRQTKPNPKIK